ncbi:hypothetical protein D9M71_310200 [compost metagenome]
MAEAISASGAKSEIPTVDRGPSELSGGVVTTLAGKRTLKLYLLTDDNLETLSTLNNLFNLFLTLTTFLLSLGIGALASATLATGVTENLKNIWLTLGVTFSIFGVGAAVACIWANIKKGNNLTKIKNETVHEVR